MRHTLLGIAAVCLCWMGLTHANGPIPVATGYVTDQTGVIDPAEMARTQILLGRYEVATGRKLAVLLVPATPDEELEAYADRVLRAWNMDSADQGGALLLWSAEGYILIRVAGPLGERLRGEVQSEILSRWVVPAFGRGEAGVGIRQGVERMIAVLDGGEVGSPSAEPGQTDLVTDGEAAAGGAAEPETLAAERAVGAASDAQVGLDPPPEMPAWFERLPEDLARLRGGLSRSLDGGIGAWLGEARQQVGQLFVLVPALALQMRGERVEPAFHPLSVGAGYAMAGVLGLGSLLLWGRAITAAVMLVGIGGGVALWVATGLTALASCMALIGILAPVLVPVLRALLRGADDSEREQPPLPGFPQSRSFARAPTSAGMHQPPQRPGAATAVRSTKAHAQKVDDLGNLVRAVVRERLRQVRPTHGVVALVLLLISPPLAILGLLGLSVLIGYRDGIAYRVVELFVAEKELSERLRQQLPPPKL